MHNLELASYIDYALLKPTFSYDDIVKGCQLAKDYQVATVCVAPTYVNHVAEIFKNSDIGVTTVIGFPHGNQTMHTKAYAIQEAMLHGASELDVVVNIGRVLGGDWHYVQDELCWLIRLVHQYDKKIKIIFANGYLPGESIRDLSFLCESVYPDWIKTSTGYELTGATIEDVQLMHKYAPSVPIKVAGGIKDRETALRFLALGGVTRIGTSSLSTIFKGEKT